MVISEALLIRLAEERLGEHFHISYNFENGIDKPLMMVTPKFPYPYKDAFEPEPVFFLTNPRTYKFAKKHKDLHPFHMFYAIELEDGSYDTIHISSWCYFPELPKHKWRKRGSM